jgi:hypothetical protein
MTPKVNRQVPTCRGSPACVSPPWTAMPQIIAGVRDAHLDVQWRVISRSAPGRGTEPGLPGQPKVAVAAFGHRWPLAANLGPARAPVRTPREVLLQSAEISCPRGPHL